MARVGWQTYTIDGNDLLTSCVPDVPVSKVLRFEGCPTGIVFHMLGFMGSGRRTSVRSSRDFAVRLAVRLFSCVWVFYCCCLDTPASRD